MCATKKGSHFLANVLDVIINVFFYILHSQEYLFYISVTGRMGI